MEIFEVTILYPSTKTDTVFVQGNDTQKLIKLQIEDKCGINPEAMSLYLHETCLDNQLLSTYNITKQITTKFNIFFLHQQSTCNISTFSQM